MADIILKSEVLDDIKISQNEIAKKLKISFGGITVDDSKIYHCSGLYTPNKGNTFNSKSLYALELFNEKVDKLRNSRFIDHIRSEGLSLNIRGTINTDNTGSIEYKESNIDQDSIDAFVLTIRFFINSSELCSLREMENHYGHLNKVFKEKFLDIKYKLDNFLESDCEHLKKKNNNTTKNMYILDVFINGGLSHCDEEKRKQYNKWMLKSKSIRVFAFNDILLRYYAYLEEIYDLNGEVLSIRKPKHK